MAKEVRAHDWKAIGSDERIPRWPSQIGEKRELRVEITSWLGIGVGAKHWYVRIDEQENGWWSEDENAWVVLSCDAGRLGYKLDASVLTEGEAIELALTFVLMVAGKGRRNHDIAWSGPGRPRWAH